ncbi:MULTISPECIES: DUF6153 family protein [Streptomyces]|uniref:Uncharacterized protein n=1 Tax=Streptomyces virginiae TaxID=1961 RepID=A0A0L8M3W9_STRVG|nr:MULTISPECIES: DUF6153 family protein [Streptomyces]KOG45039.1 hypothetical protein ADK75_33250 [Streptomyces virginiae]KOU18136.1 hypothetical protein ADK51_29580 [Streptomyces sp. WM6368]
MTRSARRAAPGVRLLLLAALLLGIVTMHTLGHPTESHAMEDVSPAHSVASAGPAAPAGHGGTRHTAVPAADAPAPAVSSWGHTMPATEMDPMSVCLAVLAGLVVVLIGTGRPGSRAAAPLGGAARIPGRSGGGPDPPAPRELLTRLAVLRI